MSDPRRRPLKRDGSISSLEYSLNTLVEPQSEPITIYPGPGAQGAAMSKVDLEIVNRLKRLRQIDHDSVPTEDEVSARLAALKGLPSDYYTKKSNIAYQPPKNHSQTQQIDQLLSQVVEEVSIDARQPCPVDELEARLARLRGEEVPHRDPPNSGLVSTGGALNYNVPSGAMINSNLGDELNDIDMTEVESLMLEAAKADNSAKKSMKALATDADIAEALASIAKEKNKEKYSDSEEDEIVLKHPDEKVTNDEIQKVIDLYSKSKNQKKKKKKDLKNKSSDTSDSEESSSEELTSDGEKFSDSDELSD